MKPRSLNKLMSAITENDIRSLKALIDAKADVNVKNEEGQIPIVLAVKNNNKIALVNMLIEAKADLTLDEPSHVLSIHGNGDVLKVLIEAKADVNAKNEEGDNPLIVASTWGSADLVKILLAAKADVNVTDEEGWTPFMRASRHGKADLVVQMLLEAKADVNAKDKGGLTSLMIVSRQGNANLVKMLLEAKANVNAKDEHGNTSLIEATMYGNANMIDIFLAAKADVNVTTDENGKANVIDILLAAKADVNAKDAGGRTALMISAIIGRESIASQLIDAKADLTLTDNFGQSVFDRPGLSEGMLSLLTQAKAKQACRTFLSGTVSPLSVLSRAAGRPHFEPGLLPMICTYVVPKKK